MLSATHRLVEGCRIREALRLRDNQVDAGLLCLLLRNE
jgi:hypothetical protein